MIQVKKIMSFASGGQTIAFLKTQYSYKQWSDKTGSELMNGENILSNCLECLLQKSGGDDA